MKNKFYVKRQVRIFILGNYTEKNESRKSNENYCPKTSN